MISPVVVMATWLAFSGGIWVKGRRVVAERCRQRWRAFCRFLTFLLRLDAMGKSPLQERVITVPSRTWEHAGDHTMPPYARLRVGQGEPCGCRAASWRDILRHRPPYEGRYRDVEMSAKATRRTRIMPVHAWTRVTAGTFHDFHNAWITELRNALNGGVLPAGYYALGEQRSGDVSPDVLTLHAETAPPRQTSETASDDTGMIA